MTDLSLLKVSLTKHNAHKIAQILKEHPADQILTRLDEVHAEKAQAHKNLSISKTDDVPEVWSDVQNLGDNAINALVLIGIIFSHHELISAMTNASSRNGFSGRIERNAQIDGKAYTNFARVLDQLGFVTKLDYSGVTFNLKGMFEIPGLGPLVSKLLSYKLYAANWDGKGSIGDEAIKYNFQQVFGVSAEEFRTWLSTDIQPASAGNILLPKDEEFFQADNDDDAKKSFTFEPGHTERAVEAITKVASKKTVVSQLHNDIQNRLYQHLCEQLGKDCVGTELDTGNGTTVDLVTQYKNDITFFEIKTSPSVRTNIRQAIPQLLEYAYWPEEKRANKLVIVSHLPLTSDGKKYLDHLNKNFNLQISYNQFDLSTNKLV